MISNFSIKFSVNAVLFALAFLIPAGAFAQSTISSAGGDAGSSSGSMSFTIGEVCYTKSAAISEGVQQTTLSVEENGGKTTNVQNALTADIKVYPNPVADILNVECKDIAESTYKIYSPNGVEFTDGVCGDGKTSIDMSGAVPGVYTLIIENDGRIKSYKIIKKTR